VEDVAAGHSQRVFQVQGGRRFDAAQTVGVIHQNLLNRFGQNGIQ
jgi:hypothetical protein